MITKLDIDNPTALEFDDMIDAVLPSTYRHLITALASARALRRDIARRYMRAQPNTVEGVRRRTAIYQEWQHANTIVVKLEDALFAEYRPYPQIEETTE